MFVMGIPDHSAFGRALICPSVALDKNQLLFSCFLQRLDRVTEQPKKIRAQKEIRSDLVQLSGSLRPRGVPGLYFLYLSKHALRLCAKRSLLK
jgi:hypothetical protein